MGSCNARVLSYIVAGLHIVGSVLAIVYFCMYTPSEFPTDKDKKVKNSRDWKKIIYRFWFVLPVMVLIKSCILIKGIMQKRDKLIAGFLGGMALVIFVLFIWALADFVMELEKGRTFGSVSTDLLINCGLLVVELIILSPVMTFRNKISDAPDNESQTLHESSCTNNPNKSSNIAAESV